MSLSQMTLRHCTVVKHCPLHSRSSNVRSVDTMERFHSMRHSLFGGTSQIKTESLPSPSANHSRVTPSTQQQQQESKAYLIVDTRPSPPRKPQPHPLACLAPLAIVAAFTSFGLWSHISEWMAARNTKAQQKSSRVSASSSLDEQHSEDLMENETFSEIFDVFDANKDGMVDFKEAVVGLSKVMPPSTDVQDARDIAQDVFLLFDQDRKRVLDRYEFAAFLSGYCSLLQQPLDVVIGQWSRALTSPPPLDHDQRQQLRQLEAETDQQIQDSLVGRKVEDLYQLWGKQPSDLIPKSQVAQLLHGFLDTVQLEDEEAQSSAEKYITKQFGDASGPAYEACMSREDVKRELEGFANSAKVDVLEVVDALVMLPVCSNTPFQGTNTEDRMEASTPMEGPKA